MSLPKDPRLAEIARALEETSAVAALCDSEWTLVWVSEEMKESALREHDEDKLGIGKHVLEAYLSDTWCSKLTPETQVRMLVEEFPVLINGTPGGKARLESIWHEAHARWIEQGEDLDRIQRAKEAEELQVFSFMEPVEPSAVWTNRMEVVLDPDLPPLEIVEIGVRLFDKTGELLGTALVYNSGLPAGLLQFVTRGDRAMYERMMRLVDPGPRAAAILFADLQESFALSRRLPSASYFRLIRALTTAIDDGVIRNRGVVGKHAGDGATAFFLADDLRSSSGAVKAAIRAARDLMIAARDAAKEIGEESGLMDPDECLVNVGLHWGGTLYMGQLVTGGRLEVTALGDEVNECARIQESARDGTVLASKVLIEHLSPADADELDIDPGGMLYRTIGDLPEASKKAMRDAGGIPVTAL